MASYTDRNRDDLTARARIRDAALSLFAERGIARTTIRDIARAAGVSGGLVRHHFGSKDDLRSACDAYVLDELTRLKEPILDGRVGDPGFMSAVHPAALLANRYIARSLVDGSPAAEAMFDQLVERTQAWLEQHHPGRLANPHDYAALLVAAEAGQLAMHERLSRAFGTDIFSSAGHLRLALTKIDFYSQPLLSPEVADQARSTIEQLRTQRSPGFPGSEPPEPTSRPS